MYYILLDNGKNGCVKALNFYAYTGVACLVCIVLK